MARPRPKECPGCHQQAIFYAGNVCMTCQRKIDEHPTLKAQVEAASSARSQTYHLGKYLPLPMGCYKAGGTEALAEDFVTFLRLACPSTEYEPGAVDGYGREIAKLYVEDQSDMWRINHREPILYGVRMTHEAWQALRNLRMSMGRVMYAVRAAGELDGQNTLFQLNSGKLSMDDFADRELRLVKTRDTGRR